MRYHSANILLNFLYLSATVGATATATTSRRRGWPVIDGGSRGAVGVATQVAGASCVDVGEAEAYYA